MPIWFGTYNIRTGSNRGLELALRGMSQANTDLGIFQETKVTDGIYTQRSDGYSVVAMDAPITAALATEGLEDMSAHFLSRRHPWCRDGRMWSMLREGREVRYRTDFIVGTDHRLFGNVSVRYPRHNSDHYLVLGCLHIASLKEHTQYLGGRKRLPLRPPTKPTREDKIFAALRRAVPKAQAREARRNEWISAATWRLVNERISARRDTAKG